MAKFKKLSKAYQNLQEEVFQLNVLLGVLTEKNGGTLLITKSQLSYVKDKYFTLEKTNEGFTLTVTKEKISY